MACITATMNKLNSKYSVVMPVLNGYKTLSLTLKPMLAIDRDDVEWVISDNHSDDNLFDYIESLCDPRIKLIRPPSRMPAGQHLEFAYRHATGEWQGHLGDDDYLMPSRFDVLDSIIKQHPEIDIIRGEHPRYVWPDYPVQNEANRLIPGKSFSGVCQILDSKDLARYSLNEFAVHGGGAWMVRRHIIEAVRQRAGFFSSPQNLEFFAMRAALAVSKKAAVVDLPIAIIGRHAGSSGSQALTNEKQVKSSDWSWSFEDPDLFHYTPYQYKGYGPISMDGAMRVADLFQNELGNGLIDMSYWAKAIKGDMENMITIGKLPADFHKQYNRVIARLPMRIRINVLAHNFAETLFHKSPAPLQQLLIRILKRNGQPAPTNNFGWPTGTDASEFFGATNIVDLAHAIEQRYETWFDPYRQPS